MKLLGEVMRLAVHCPLFSATDDSGAVGRAKGQLPALSFWV